MFGKKEQYKGGHGGGVGPGVWHYQQNRLGARVQLPLGLHCDGLSEFQILASAHKQKQNTRLRKTNTKNKSSGCLTRLPWQTMFPNFNDLLPSGLQKASFSQKKIIIK